MTVREIQATDVELAMLEADELGRRAFLDKHGFRYATSYLVRHEGRFYDPKALAGVAHGFRDDQVPLAHSEFDATEAIARLRTLGYEVVPFKGMGWVNQGATFREERQGGYVWAPKLTKAGRPAAHHVAVSQLRVGQQIVHYAAGAIRAIGYVSAEPESVSKPDELTTDAWDVDGYGCAVSYRDITPPIPKEDVPNRTSDVGPFDVNGDLKQGYMFPVSNEHVFPLLEFLNARVPDLFAEPASADLHPFREQVAVADNPIHDLLQSAKNVVLEGVPGTGKSFAIERLADEWRERTGRELVRFGDRPYAAQVMHPSSSYEDFIEGLRPRARSADDNVYFDQQLEGGGDFVVEDGFFLRVCALATKHPDKDVLVLIDELNRCNVPSVLGDLLLTVEASRRAKFVGHDSQTATARDWTTAVPARLPYSRRLFFVPENVYLVATTNTTDRSVAPLDAAIRRRFAFFRIEPDFTGPVSLAKQSLGNRAPLLINSAEVMSRLNDSVLASCLGPDAMLGQSYLFTLLASLAAGEDTAAVVRTWRFSVVPQLIDVLRSYGAEALLDPATRAEWFVEHGTELVNDIDVARVALEEFDAHLAGLGMRILVDGTGLARGARVVDATSLRRDTSDRAVQLQLEGLESEAGQAAADA